MFGGISLIVLDGILFEGEVKTNDFGSIITVYDSVVQLLNLKFQNLAINAIMILSNSRLENSSNVEFTGN